MKFLKIKNLSNRRFGKLTVTTDYKREDMHTYWRVRCDCGVVTWMRQNSLRQGAESCGCDNPTRFPNQSL